MVNDDENRWVQRLENLKKANNQLKSACSLDKYTDLELAGLVKSFEMTFELAWKTLKDLLYYEGYEVRSPRETVLKAFDAKLIDTSEQWLAALQSRNIMTHTYNAKAAAEAEKLIKDQYAPMIDNLITALMSRRPSR